jgi:hypothetical protein
MQCYWITSSVRARRERPCGGGAAEQSDELPPSHSITSSRAAESMSEP